MRVRVLVRVRVLSHSTANTTANFGRYGFADAGGAPMGGLTPFAENANTFDGEPPTCIELRVTAPVPEPGAWALMVGGLAPLGGRLRRNA